VIENKEIRNNFRMSREVNRIPTNKRREFREE
jgi:hypothetical protein